MPNCWLVAPSDGFHSSVGLSPLFLPSRVALSDVDAMTGHPERAARFIELPQRAAWHDQSLWFVRARRDKAVRTLPEWESLREAAAAIKAQIGRAHV